MKMRSRCKITLLIFALCQAGLADIYLTQKEADDLNLSTLRFVKSLFDKAVLEATVTNANTGALSVQRNPASGAIPANATYSLIAASGNEPPKLINKNCLPTLVSPNDWNQIFSTTGALPSTATCAGRESVLKFIKLDSAQNKVLVEVSTTYKENSAGKSIDKSAVQRALLSLPVAASTPPEIMCFQATDGGQYFSDNLSVVSGTNVKLRWAAENANQCTLASTTENGLSRDDVDVGAMGSSRSYTLSCQGASGAPVTKTINIAVKSETPWTFRRGSAAYSRTLNKLAGSTLPYTSRYVFPNHLTDLLKDSSGRMVGINMQKFSATTDEAFLYRFDGTDWTSLPFSYVPSDNTSHWGTKGTAAATNRPMQLKDTYSWLDGSGRLWFWGGHGYNYPHYNQIFRWDPATSMWTWIHGPNSTMNTPTWGTQGTADPNNVPPYRASGAYWKDNTGRIFIFGGEEYIPPQTTSNLYSDLWRFDGTNWTWLKGPNTFNQAGNYGTLNTAAATNNPGARTEATYWKDNAGNFWMFGGYGYTSDASAPRGIKSDLWMFNGTNWIWKGGSNTVGEVPVYGTKGVTAATNKIGRRKGAAAATDASGNHWIFGGFGVDKNNVGCYLNDLWKYDGTNWTWMSGDDTCPPGASQLGPHRRPMVRGVPTLESSPPPSDMYTRPRIWFDSSNRLWIHSAQGTWVYSNHPDPNPTAAVINPIAFSTNCYVSSAGGLICWGYDFSTIKTPMAGMGSGVTQVDFNCAIQNGGVKCWNYTHFAGQVQTDQAGPFPSATSITGLASGVTKIYAGFAIQNGALYTFTPAGGRSASAFGGLTAGVTDMDYSCAIQNGGLKCWGTNISGEVGDGTTTPRANPTPVVGMDSGVTAIAAMGPSHCAIQNGTVKCWGYGGEYALGDGTTANSSVPKVVPGLESGVTALVGDQKYCAIKSGRVYCWGYGPYSSNLLFITNLTDAGTYPPNLNLSVPRTPFGLECGVTDIATYGTRVCAKQFGKLKCFGMDGDWVNYTNSKFNGNAYEGRNRVYAEPIYEP